MKTLSFLLFCVMSLGAYAQNTVTIQEITEIVLLRGTSKVATHDSWESCERDMDRRARAETQTSGTRTFACQTEKRKVVATYGPAPVVPPPPPPPAPPINLGDNGTLLTWQARPGTPDDQPWKIEQRPTGCNDASQPFAPVARNVVGLSHSVASLAPGTYTFRVAAEGGVAGEYSNEWCKTITAPLPPPTGSYTLQRAIQGVPFAVNLPAPPNVASEQVVTPANLATYINTPGLRLVLSAGTYGHRSFPSQDQEIVMRDGAQLYNIQLTASSRRIKFRGETPRVGRFHIIDTPWEGGPQDIVFDGVYSAAGPGTSPSNVMQCTRCAIINSYLQSTSYGVASMPSGSFGARDLIIANNKIFSTVDQSLVRLMNVSNLVFVDNLASKPSIGLLFRLHSDATRAPADNAYIVRNQIEGLRGDNYANVIAPGSNPNNTPVPMRGVVFENNDLYGPGGIIFGDANSRAEAPVIRNNRHFGGPGNVWQQQSWMTGWVMQGNTVLPAQAPPGWNYR